MFLLTSTTKQLLILYSLYLFQPTECSNILFFIGFGGQSHRISMEPLANALIEKGHNVTFLVQENPSTHKNPKTNYYVSEQVVNFFESFIKDSNNDVDFYKIRKEGKMSFSWFLVPWYTVNVCQRLYSDPSFHKLIRDTKFDLILVDGLFSECAYGVAHLHQSKLILFVVSSITPWIVDATGIPDESASIPDMLFNFPEQMNFGQRVINAVMPIFWRLYKEWYHFPQLERITNEGLKAKTPSFNELERKIDLVLVNTHVAQEYPRSLPPNIVPIGGISWSENRKPLPKELEDFINRGTEGFVYVSFGSYIDFAMFPPEVQQTFLKALSNFPKIHFIWKMNKEPENLPSNIFVQKWMPQQDILFHPKIKVFITHAGLGGTNEAIYGSVPLLCFPVFAEQDYNARLVESKGIGLNMEITTLTEEDLTAALAELLSNNKMYRDNMNRIHKQFLDRPMKPVETALWWTEYVLRQDTLDFRKPVNVNYSWWKRRQIDVWLFLSVVVFTIVSFVMFLQWKMLKFLYRASVKQVNMMRRRFTIQIKAKRGSRRNGNKHKRN